MPYIKSKSYTHLRAAWARGRGHQAEQLSLPGSMGRNRQEPWRGLPRLHSALLLQ